MEARPVAFIQILNQSCQYSIPLWQRRYSWGDREIGQLMSDLELAAQKSETDPEYRHYCGAMITHTVGNPAGTINYHQVIDGQQRLTTISLLLQCVAQSMDEESSFGTWNRANIHQKLLTNQGVSISESRKLKLQDIDEKEYSSIIDNQGQNSQTNTRIGYAYKKLKQHIKNIGAFTLMKGFQHLWIVSIVLQAHDDPQQVFESLNTTGRPLTEGEKIKNWLLSGLDPESQSRLYQNYWREIEIALGEVPSQSSEHIASKDASKNIDLFFREFLFWKLGIEVRKNDVYLDFRKWAINNHLDKDKHELAEQLCLCARLYGFIIGTFTYPKFSRKIDAVVRRLREQPLDVHRPLTLRILHDKVNPNYFLTDSEISDSIQLVETWFIRTWLSGRPSRNLSRVIAVLAHGNSMVVEGNYVKYWGNKIANQVLGVPSDDELEEGITKRQAYGGANTKMAKAIFCALMESEQSVYPDPKNWTIEHIMPRTLNEIWKQELGADYRTVHEQYKNRLSNLTLIGTGLQSKASNDPFHKKKKFYKESGFTITQDLVAYSKWNQDSLMHRRNFLIKRLQNQWQWDYRTKNQKEVYSILRWRMNEGDWHYSDTFHESIVDVVDCLLTENPQNFNLLLDPAGKYRYQKYESIPEDRQKAYIKMPRNPEFAIRYQTAKATIKCLTYFCSKCSVQIRIECFYEQFWSEFKQRTGGVQGQTTNHFSQTIKDQTIPLDNSYVEVSLLKGQVELKIKSKNPSQSTVQLLLKISEKIRDLQPNELTENEKLRELASKGATVTLSSPLILADRISWYDSMDWIKKRYEMLIQLVHESVESVA